MSLMPTEPRSIGGVLDDAIGLYRRSLSACLPIALIGVLVTLVPGIWVALRLQALAATGDPTMVWGMFMSPSVLLAYLCIALFYSIIYGALIHQINAVAHGQRATLGEAFSVGLQRLPVLFVVAVLFFLAVMVGMVLLVIPGIWLWGLLQLAFVAAIVERTGVFESFAVSRSLVRGNWWRANLTIFVAFVIMIVVLMVLSAIAGIVLAMTTSAETVASTGGQVVSQVISAVLNLFTLSYFPCVLQAVFNDLKLRKEGGDLVSRVGALTPAG